MAFVAAWSIFVYNQTVNLSHEFSAKEREYKTSLTQNAELKNEKYSLTDAKNLRVAADAGGLVKVSNPEYFESVAAPELAAR